MGFVNAYEPFMREKMHEIRMGNVDVSSVRHVDSERLERACDVKFSKLFTRHRRNDNRTLRHAQPTAGLRFNARVLLW